METNAGFHVVVNLFWRPLATVLYDTRRKFSKEKSCILLTGSATNENVLSKKIVGCFRVSIDADFITDTISKATKYASNMVFPSRVIRQVVYQVTYNVSELQAAGIVKNLFPPCRMMKSSSRYLFLPWQMTKYS